MPTYNVQSPSGQTLQIQGDQPPTEKELDDIFAQMAPPDARAPVKLAPIFGSQQEFEQAKQRQANTDTESLGAKAGYAAKALGSSATKVALPALALAAPLTGGASLALGAGAGALGEYLGNQISGEETTPGGVASAAIFGGTPIRSLPTASALETLGTGVKLGLTGLAGETARTALDEQRLPSAAQAATAFAVPAVLGTGAARMLDSGSGAIAASNARSADSVRRETVRLGNELGLVVPPSVVNPNVVNDVAQSVAGKAATAQAAVLKNQPKLNSAVKAEIGLSEDAPLSTIAINTQRTAPNAVYERIGKVSDAAKNLLESFKQSNADANQLYATYRAMPIKDPAVLARAKQADIDAKVYKEWLADEIGPKLAKEFEGARVRLAKIGLADESVRVGDGNVDASVFGDALENGRELTGAFRKIGRFQSAFGKYVQEAAKTPPSGVDYLKMLGGLGLGGTAGFAAGGVPGAIAGVAAAEGAQRGARRLILSPFYQKRFAQPAYPTPRADIAGEAARLGTLNAPQSQ